MLTVGLDVHQSRSSVCVLDARGNILKQHEVKGDYAALAESLAQLRAARGPFQVCYEASTGYGALHQKLAPLAARVTVAHPGKLRLIFQSSKKHNRADAQKIAVLMHLNQVPAVHVPSQDVRSWRGLIEHRGHLVNRNVAVKNQIRALLRTQGLRGLPGERQWTKAGLAWLEKAPWPTALETLRLTVLLGQLADLGGQIQRVTAALDQRAAAHAGVRLLQTIPGVGPRTAEAFVAYVDDPRRFRAGTIGAYFGLVPREDSTGNHRHLGHITREGPATVRKLLTEACWSGMAHSRRIREVYQRVGQGQKGRRKLAAVATAHWLCRVMLAMLKTGEVFREAPDAPEATASEPTQ